MPLDEADMLSRRPAEGSGGLCSRTHMLTALLLTISNVFMTFAWYGHLKYKAAPLWIAIGVSWLIAFVEYCFQVPANRIGHQHFTAPQLKIMQEVITLVVFGVFSVLYLDETPRWNEIVGFLLIAAAVVVVFVMNPRHASAASPAAAVDAMDAAEPVGNANATVWPDTREGEAPAEPLR